MALEFRNGAWYWRKMVNGVQFKKWEHEAVQTVVYDGERPVTLHEAIINACTHMKRWQATLLNCTEI